MIRAVETDADLEQWVAIRNAVVPNEPTTVEQSRALDEPDRLLLLADDMACGLVDRSSFGGRAAVAVRVRAEHRRKGIGSAMYRALATHARSLGLEGVNSFVYADEPHSIAFAEHFGLAEVDYQLEQARSIGDEPAPRVPDGIEVLSLAGRRDELLQAAWPVAREGHDDLPLPGEVTVTFESWSRDDATRPEGSFVALEHGEVVGFAGLTVHASPATAEHGLTAVRRDRRGRGIGRALKQAQLHWAATSGVAELITWTQRGNEAMQALNRSLGYLDKSKVITFQGPLP